MKLTFEETVHIAKDIIINYVRKEGSFITYSKLSEILQNDGINIPAHSTQMSKLLEEVSLQGHKDGIGLISVFVVTKYDSQMPSTGFFDLAKRLKLFTGDKEVYWISELRRVKENLGIESIDLD